MSDNVIVSVKNRSRATIAYTIPDMNIRRVFTPGETKKISEAELVALSYRPGGPAMLQRNLMIMNKEVAEELTPSVEPEYWMDDEEVKKLLMDTSNKSVDRLLDLLDFAPAGVKDLVKKYAVELPVQDVRKRAAIKEKTGLDVDMVLIHNRDMQEEEGNVEQTAPKRRVRAEEPENARRADIPKYNVVSRPAETEE
jgi:hypothetical protein